MSIKKTVKKELFADLIAEGQKFGELLRLGQLNSMISNINDFSSHYVFGTMPITAVDVTKEGEPEVNVEEVEAERKSNMEKIKKENQHILSLLLPVRDRLLDKISKTH
jgi:hypothetical protein